VTNSFNITPVLLQKGKGKVVPPLHEGVLGEWKYSSVHSSSQH